MPQRIQLHRSKGWRKPEDAVVVSRPTRWGNPFVIEQVPCEVDEGAKCWRVTDEAELWAEHLHSASVAREYAVRLFAQHIAPGGRYEYSPATLEIARRELAGKDLACWCPLDQACHAEVLMDMVNPQ